MMDGSMIQKVCKIILLIILISISLDCYPIDDIIKRYSHLYEVDNEVIFRIIRIESDFRRWAKGKSDEIGLMQIKYSTATQMGYKGSVVELFYPENNLRYGIKYFKECLRKSKGSILYALYYYNTGVNSRKITFEQLMALDYIKKFLNQGVRK